jgi:hypothetical protein
MTLQSGTEIRKNERVLRTSICHTKAEQPKVKSLKSAVVHLTFINNFKLIKLNSLLFEKIKKKFFLQIRDSSEQLKFNTNNTLFMKKVLFKTIE